MSGLPMIACSDRRPMFPVVHWITRNGRSALVVLIGCSSCAGAIGLIMINRGPRAREPGAPTGRLSFYLKFLPSYFLGVQPGELLLSVLLDTGGAPDLAARCGGNRPGRYQNEVPDIQAVRIGYRGGDVAFDAGEPVHRLLVGIASLLELDDGDQFLGTVQRDRYRRDPTTCDLLDRRLNVLGIVVTPMDDQQILDAADNEQLTLEDETQVTGS